MENSARPQNWKRSVFIPIPKKGNAKKCSTAVAKSLQSCPTLCDPVDSSPPGSIVPGILQARTLEWVAISFSNAWKWKVKVKSLSRVQLFATPWTIAYQSPLSVGFSRQECWSGLPLPSPQVNASLPKRICIPKFQEVSAFLNGVSPDSLLQFHWRAIILGHHNRFWT